MDKKFRGASKSQKERQSESVSLFVSSPSSPLCAVRHEGCGRVRLDSQAEYSERASERAREGGEGGGGGGGS